MEAGLRSYLLRLVILSTLAWWSSPESRGLITLPRRVISKRGEAIEAEALVPFKAR